MKRSLTFALILLFVSPAVHALTSSCDAFQNSDATTERAKLQPIAFDKSSTDKSIAGYQRASVNVYQSLCGKQPIDSARREQAIDSFVLAYATARFGNSGARVEQRMGLQMLAVIAMTHELPARFRTDAHLREAWMQDCQDSCFSQTAEFPTSADVNRAQYERLLRDEVLDHLQASAGVVEVKRMLWNASIASAN